MCLHLLLRWTYLWLMLSTVLLPSQVGCEFQSEDIRSDTLALLQNTIRSSDLQKGDGGRIASISESSGGSAVSSFGRVDKSTSMRKNSSYNLQQTAKHSSRAQIMLHPFDFSEINVHLPDDYTGQTPLPLIVMLHGYSSTPSQYENLYGLQDLVNSSKFIQITPPGRKDDSGYRSWQAWGTHCGNCASSSALPCCGDGDVEHLRAIIYSATRNFNVDPTRIYLNGHSDGAAMAYRFACDAADVVAAVMVLAGSPPEDNWKSGYACRPSAPVSVLHIHGTADTDVQFAGSTSPPYKGAVGASELFANFNACPKRAGHWLPAQAGVKGDTKFPEKIRLLSRSKGNDTEVFHVPGCKDGTDIELWKIIDEGHGPGFDRKRYEEHSVAWLLRHRKMSPHIATPPVCVDKPLGWEDSAANRCQDYAQKKWCNRTGGYGTGWRDSRGWMRDYAASGVSALSACCACGGGSKL